MYYAVCRSRRSERNGPLKNGYTYRVAQTKMEKHVNFMIVACCTELWSYGEDDVDDENRWAVPSRAAESVNRPQKRRPVELTQNVDACTLQNHTGADYKL